MSSTTRRGDEPVDSVHGDEVLLWALVPVVQVEVVLLCETCLLKDCIRV